MKFLPRRLFFTGLMVLIFAALITTTRGQANTVPDQAVPPPNEQAAKFLAAMPETIRGENPSTLPPPAKQDPCLHCHVEGEIVWEWSPISRWLVFGAMGFTFVFGISRNVIVWRTREPWHHRWMYYFGGITAVFFAFQIVIGLALAVLYGATAQNIPQVVSVLKTIHWGSGIILFVAALGLSFAGASFPWYQRPFWAMVFITTIIGGALAVANLSFAHLYAEWQLPPAPGHLYAFHIMLIPIVIAGITSIYFIILRKRGETP